jgi:hypothetical protein
LQLARSSRAALGISQEKSSLSMSWQRKKNGAEQQQEIIICTHLRYALRKNGKVQQKRAEMNTCSLHRKFGGNVKQLKSHGCVIDAASPQTNGTAHELVERIRKRLIDVNDGIGFALFYTSIR